MTFKSCPRFHNNNGKVKITFVLYKLKITFKATSKSALRTTLTMTKFRLIFSQTKVDSLYKFTFYIVSKFRLGLDASRCGL